MTTRIEHDTFRCDHGRHYVDCHICFTEPEIPLEKLQEMLTESKKLKMKKDALYFITFTTQNEVDVDKWKKRLAFEMSRKFVESFQLVIEHEDANIHAHVLLHANGYIKRDKFKTYIKSFGYIDFKKVKFDNGIFEYITKEANAEIYTDPIQIYKVLEPE